MDDKHKICEKNYDSLRDWVGEIQDKHDETRERLTRIEGIATECNKRSETNEDKIARLKSRAEEIMAQFLNCKATHELIDGITKEAKKEKRLNWLAILQAIATIVAVSTLLVKLLYQ